MAEDKSTAESLRGTRTYGQVRCMNPSCESRITPAPGQTQAKCPRCGSEWRIFWIKPGFPRVKGPVWETSAKLANEKLAALSEKPAKAEKKEGK